MAFQGWGHYLSTNNGAMVSLWRCIFDGKCNRGSVLVMVLWILVIISFLSSEYIAHNREKTAIALHSTEVFNREAAAFSVLELFASAHYDLLKIKSQEENADSDTAKNISERTSKTADKIGTDQNDTKKYIQSQTVPWIRLRPGGVSMWVKVENESSRVQLSLGQEQNIRTRLQNFYGDDRIKEAEAFADSLLDWLDPDDLVRLNGAEKEYYNQSYPPCDTGNGPFKSIAQMFLVKGFGSEIFWGSPYQYILELPIYDDLREDYEHNLKSYRKSSKDESNQAILDNGKMQTILEQFTIYPKGYIRISMLFPGENDRWYNEIFWVTKERASFKLVEQLSRVMVVRMNL